MTTPRKFTFERSRDLAEEILCQYEAGATPKQLCDRYDLMSNILWWKIRQARKWRERAATTNRERCAKHDMIDLVMTEACE